MTILSGLRSAYKKSYGVYLFLAWSAVIAFSLMASVYGYHGNALANAAIEAGTHLRLNLEYRAMVASLGGVYASVDKISPNPYLSVPKRDIKTQDGDRLTLLNPAYMTRLIFERIKGKSAQPVINKITSLKPYNPGNAPDDWEKRAVDLLNPSLLQPTDMENRRSIFSSLVYLEIDEQGRFVTPKNLLEYGQLKDKAVIIGVGDHFEIWEAEKWHKYSQTIKSS